MRLKLKPAEISYLLSSRVTTPELIRVTLHELIYRDVLQLNCKKSQIPGESAHVNAFYFSVGNNFEQYEPKGFEVPILRPFVEVRKGLPLPLYVTMILQNYDGHLNRYRRDFVQLLEEKGLINKGLLPSFGINKYTTEGAYIKNNFQKLINNISFPTPPTPDKIKRHLINYKELIVLSQLPYKLLEQVRLKLVELLLIELKSTESNTDSDLFKNIKFTLTYLANPDFTFSNFAENFDQQLTAALEEEA